MYLTTIARTAVFSVFLSLPASAGSIYVFRENLAPVLQDLAVAPGDGWFAPAGNSPFADSAPSADVVYGVELRERVFRPGHGRPEPPKTPEIPTLLMVLTGTAGICARLRVRRGPVA